MRWTEIDGGWNEVIGVIDENCNQSQKWDSEKWEWLNELEPRIPVAFCPRELRYWTLCIEFDVSFGCEMINSHERNLITAEPAVYVRRYVNSMCGLAVTWVKQSK